MPTRIDAIRKGGDSHANEIRSLRRVAALVATLALAAGTATAAPSRPALTLPAAGTTQTGGTLSGVAKITSFALNSAGQLVANGTVTGTLTDASGAVTKNI